MYRLGLSNDAFLLQTGMDSKRSEAEREDEQPWYTYFGGCSQRAQLLKHLPFNHWVPIKI
jgi:hypothetical protein